LDVSSAHAAVVGPQVTAPVLYRGIGFVAAPRKLSFVVAKAADTAYAGTAGKRAGEAPACTGSDCAVVGAMQARNNARFLLVGSLEALADALMTKASGNAAFAEELSEWAFGEKSLLRVKSTAIHNLAPKHPGHYTVKDEAVCGWLTSLPHKGCG
jgi:oligosaccharyltransferase complex subunit beta